MGWSCTAAAGRALDKWHDACVEATGVSNTFEANGNKFFFEVGREHTDGRITGAIRRVTAVQGSLTWTVKSGSFRIDPDGKIHRAPKFLRDAVANPVWKWVVKRDGEVKAEHTSDEEAYRWLLKAVPYSIDHATKHEGWAVKKVRARGSD